MAQNDLSFYKPEQWYAGAVITTDSIEHDSEVEMQTLPDYQNLYLSFGTGNCGEVLSDAYFVVVYIDGEFYRTIELDSLQPEYYKTFTNLELGSFSAGTHLLEMALITNKEDEDTSNNYYQSTFTVEDTGRGTFADSYYGGNMKLLDCEGNFELNYGRYVFSGNFIGTEAGRKVNAKMEIFNSTGKKICTININKGKFKYKELVLPKDIYKVSIRSTDNQKTADKITFSINGEIFYKSDYEDNSIARVSDIDRYAVTVPGNPRTLIANGWVGLGDAVSVRQINFVYNGRYTFTVNTTDQLKLSLIQVIDEKGQKKEKKLTSVTVNGKKKFGKDVDFGGILLKSGTYYLQAEALKAEKGTNADYSVKVSSKSVFFIDCDDGSNDWLYEKKSGLNKAQFVVNQITSETTDVYLDINDVSQEGYDNFVGFVDAVDFAKITLSDAASLSFSLTASDAAKFVIYSLTQKTGDKYKMTALQTTKLKKASKNATEYTATTKALSLEAGEYFISMEATNAKKGASTYYNVVLNADDCVWTAKENVEASLSGGLNVQDELSFGQNGLEEALAGASGSGLSELELDSKPAWQNMLA